MAPPVVVGRPARRRVLLHAEGRAAERALVLVAEARTASSRTTSSASAATAKNPALAHRFINFILDAKVAYDNFVNYVGYTPPQVSISPSA